VPNANEPNDLTTMPQQAPKNARFLQKENSNFIRIIINPSQTKYI
jgi:hypothetical protein